MVQAIVVGRNGSHEDTIVAAATASITTWWTTRHADPAWAVWLGSAFTKTVRHTNDRELAKVAEAAGRPPVTVGDAVAYGFVPVSYEGMDRRVRRCQVAGLDLPRTNAAAPAPAAGTVIVSVNPQLQMSTGKTAAQVAHALFVHALTADRYVLERWAHGGFTFHLDHTGHMYDQAPAVSVAIRDAGYTEIEPGSMTVRAWTGGQAGTPEGCNQHMRSHILASCSEKVFNATANEPA